MPNTKRLSWALCLLRLSVFLVMLMWALDKFLRPEHAVGVFAHFYALGGLSSWVFYVLGGLELVLLLGFVIGASRRFTYGAVLFLHAVSTFSAWHQYLHPHEGANLLFFTAWPMLAACVALYLLHDYDAFTFDGARRVGRE